MHVKSRSNSLAFSILIADQTHHRYIYNLISHLLLFIFPSIFQNLYKKLFSMKLFLALIALQLCLSSAYNVVSFGAKGDGRTDSTAAFLRTWKAACSSVTPAAVSVPRGTFLIRSVSFTGPCRNRILFQISGTIVAPSNYNIIGNSEFWILFHQVSRLTVTGGTIDAKGRGFWKCRRGNNRCPGGARVSLACM